MKEDLKKIMYIVIFVLADIVIFVVLAAGAGALTGGISTETTMTEIEINTVEYEQITEHTTAEHSVLYEKSSSPFVNWMRKVIIDIRN